MREVMVVRKSDGLVVNVIVIDENSEYPVPDGYTLVDYEPYDYIDEEGNVVKRHPEQGMIINIKSKKIVSRVEGKEAVAEFVNFLRKQHEVLSRGDIRQT